MSGNSARDLGEGAGPEAAGVSEHVGLVDHGDLAPLPAGRPVEGVPDDPLHPVAGVEALLGGHLGRGALVHGAAGARVQTLGALPDHQEVDLAGLHVRQRPGGAGPQSRRAQVHVLVEREPQLEQQATLEHSRRDGRVADRAEQDRVVAGQLLDHRFGQHLTGAQVARGAEVVGGGLAPGQYGVQDLEALRHHLGADAVTGHHRDPRHRHDLPPHGIVPAAMSTER